MRKLLSTDLVNTNDYKSYFEDCLTDSCVISVTISYVPHLKLMSSFCTCGCCVDLFFCFFFPLKGPCLEYLLQYKILDTLHTLGRADVGICFTTITVSKKLNYCDIYF